MKEGKQAKETANLLLHIDINCCHASKYVRLSGNCSIFNKKCRLWHIFNNG